MPAPEAIHELIAKFEHHRKEYQTHKNETELRREFLDPFFEALGWDVFNKKSYSERFKEVLHEASVEVEGKAKAADYAFRVGDKTMFFVEAKKPSVNIGENPEPAFQLRRYGWSARLPVSLLTDFEQLAVYECGHKPAKTDKASFGRIRLFHYSEYIEKWDEIAAVFSQEAVLQGAFDQFAESAKGKKGTAQVDDAFLAEIERWRELLARNIALRNPSIRNERELNYAVQLTIDRIIFLRIGEDRGIEPEGQLQGIGNPAPIRQGNGGQVYAELVALFRRADTRYNSGLFHFADEKGQSSNPDTLTPGLQIDDKILKDILRNLYYPESPYVFNYLSADILGQVYERFLGKVIRLTAGHQARVEEKPEVRKAGGVYYTPTYIVDYIVKNTVGKLVEGMTPAQVAELKVLDPACGSGSFLLGGYQYLLNWHDDWYTHNNPEKWARGKDPAIHQAPDGDWVLTTAEKKRILLNNIHGVDIDAQAVEVTKLSLLLKVLEGESGQLSLGLERALPDLGENIKCGNSLIGPDYYEERQMPLLPDDEFYRINAFDWKKEFRQVFAQGGFDAVIGNPPYIRIQAMKEWAPTEVEFYKENYKAASKGNYDIYVVFVEKGLSVLRRNGMLGFILPHKFFNAKYGEPIREIISQGKHLSKIVHFGDQQVFSGATTYTCLMFLNKTEGDAFEFEKVEDIELWQSSSSKLSGLSGEIKANSTTSTEWNFVVGEGAELIEKLSKMPMKLENVAKRIFQGFKTGADPVFSLEERQDGNFYSNALKAEISIENDFLRPLFKSGEMKRYELRQNTRFVIFPYENGILIDWNKITSKAPMTAKYLKACKALLEKRENGRWAGKEWYCYSRNQALEIIRSPKILTADLNPFANYCFDEIGQACFPGGAAGGYGIILDDNMYLYVLGLLNSKAVDYYHRRISTNFRGGWFGYDAKIIRNIPIRLVNFSNPAEKAQHAQMVALVETMLELHKRLASANTPQDKELLSRQIESTDAAIDRLVYALYGLSEEEIKIVEGDE